MPQGGLSCEVARMNTAPDLFVTVGGISRQCGNKHKCVNGAGLVPGQEHRGLGGQGGQVAGELSRGGTRHPQTRDWGGQVLLEVGRPRRGLWTGIPGAWEVTAGPAGAGLSCVHSRSWAPSPVKGGDGLDEGYRLHRHGRGRLILDTNLLSG